MTTQSWELYPHEADMGIRGSGDTIEESFAMSAMALTAIITTPENVLHEIPVTFTCDAPDDELLLVDWLNSVIFEMATRQMLFGRFEVLITSHHLQATAWGEKVRIDKHQPAVEVKGATYTDLRVYQTDEGKWIARCKAGYYL